MDAKSALSLIHEVGVGRLGGFDGCVCTNFEVQGVHVDISCRKGSGDLSVQAFMPDFFGTVIRVHSRHLDADSAQLYPIACEVADQIKGYDGCAIAARFCSCEHDREQQCIYCNKPREEPSGYLCNACLAKTEPYNIAEEYDARRFDFVVAEDD